MEPQFRQKQMEPRRLKKPKAESQHKRGQALRLSAFMLYESSISRA